MKKEYRIVEYEGRFAKTILLTPTSDFDFVKKRLRYHRRLQKENNTVHMGRIEIQERIVSEWMNYKK